MKRTLAQKGDAYRQALANLLPSYALEHLDKALGGNADAASRLVAAAPNKLRGHILVAAFFLGTPNPAYQTIVKDVWDHDHDQVVRITKNNRAWIRKIMAAAEFDVSCLPDKFYIWRGTTRSGVIDAAKGLSWTTDRNTACWYSFRFSGHPLVLRTSVHRNEVIFFSNSREEHEIVPLANIKAQIDGTEDDWRVAYGMIEAERHKENMSRLQNSKSHQMPPAIINL